MSETNATSWRRFFDVFAPRYDEQCFTRATAAEVPFLVEHLRLQPGTTLLDVGCGTGRHSVPLAGLGCRVTGLDVSTSMLKIARERAAAAGVQVEWVRADAVDFVRPEAFDAVACLCEGAICLLGPDDDPLEHDVAILRNVERSLRPAGRLLLNVLNAGRMIRVHQDADVASGRFDPVSLTERSEAADLAPEAGLSDTLRERSYTAPELHRVLTAVGLRVRGIYGGTAGDWGLRPPRLDEYELMAMADKPG